MLFSLATRLWVAGLITCSGALSAGPRQNTVAVIFGDLHHDQASAEQFFGAIKPLKPTHLLGMGDLVGSEKDWFLEPFLTRLLPETGVSREHTFFLPGNWDEWRYGGPMHANQLFARYGNLVFENWLGQGTVWLGETRVFVSHVPIYPVPRTMLPGPGFLDGITAQNITRNVAIPPEAEFAVFAHTHRGGIFIDPQSGKPILNAGVLNGARKDPEEHRKFAVFRAATGSIEIHDLDDPKRVEWFQLPGSRAGCDGELRALGKLAIEAKLHRFE